MPVTYNPPADYIWLKEYVGKPWEAYATGPDAYDCMGALYAVATRVYGFEPCRYLDVESGNHRAIHKAIEGEKQTGSWRQQALPTDGSVVILSQSTIFHHVGIWVNANGGRVLNARDGFGVCLDSLTALQVQGFKTIEFWTPFA